jgi:integrase
MAAEHSTASLPPLTAKLIEAAEPRATDYEIADPAAPGLRLRVTPKGGKVFRWYVTSLHRVLTIGRWSKLPRPGHVTLGEARTWLERLKEAHGAGRLAAVEAELSALRPRRSAAPPAEGAVVTFRQVADDFLKHVERRRKRPDEVRRTIETDLAPALGDRPIGSITSKDIRQVVEAVVARGSPTQAGKVLAHAKQLFRFACGRAELAVAANPAYPLEADDLGVQANVCQRYLDSKEIPLLWAAIGKARFSPTVKTGLKLILLTGVRSCELLRARWGEVDLEAGTWTIPVANQKLTRKQAQKPTARPWTVPLSSPAVALFRQLEVFAQGSEWVMASPFDPEARTSEKALVAAMRKLFIAPSAKEPLLDLVEPRPTPHDLRRTMRTHLGDTLGVPWHIAERCLNHSIGRITQTYDVGDYLAERRAALEKWAAYVDRLLDPRSAKVVPLSVAGSGR